MMIVWRTVISRSVLVTAFGAISRMSAQLQLAQFRDGEMKIMRSANRRMGPSHLALMLAVLLIPCNGETQAPTVNVAIDASKTGAPISKYIYGQFLEHGGNIV